MSIFLYGWAHFWLFVASANVCVLLAVKPEMVGTKKSIKAPLSPEFPAKFPSRDVEDVTRGGEGVGGGGEGGGKPRSSAETKAVYDAYAPVEGSLKKEAMMEPVMWDIIIANCDFSRSAQSLERNVYITHSINQYVARA